MKTKFKKIALSLLLAGAIITNASGAIASNITVNMPSTIGEKKTVEQLSSGVKHENIQQFTTAGWQNINVLRVDLNDEYTKLKALLNQNGLHHTSRVSSMVEKQNAVGGINGDYFNYRPLPSAMGTLISEGEMISSPIERAYANPSLYLDKNKTGKIGYLDRRILVDNEDLKETLFINTLNKVTPDCETLTLLNRHWGAKSIGNRFHKDLIEVLIVDDEVKEIRIDKEAFTIPENGYVIAGRGKMAEPLNRFEPGQRVSLTASTISDLDDIEFAIGGGSIILRNGELALTNIHSKGNHPRTGIGINEDGTELILVTLDGRSSTFKGVSQEIFGAILKQLGAYNAMNLDGGGSTTMAIKPVGEDKARVANKPSDGGERSVVNGVGVFSNAPKGELSYLKLSTEDDKLFVNTRRNISVKGYDQYHNPAEIDNSLLKYNFEGVEGSFQGNSFIPSTPGTASIRASVGDIKGELDLRVLNEPQHIFTETEKLCIEPNSEYKFPSIYGKDEVGIKSRIYAQDIIFEVKGDIGEVRDGVFYSGENPNGGAITLRSGQGVKNILVSIGSKGELVHGFESIEDYKFSAWPNIVPGNLSSSGDFKDGKSSVALNYDFTQGEGTRAAYINLYTESSGLKLKDVPTKLGLWVKGDGNGAWLRANILDSSKVEHTIDFAKTVDWEGWKYVEVILPSNISYPIALNRIYVAETDNDKRYKGTILVDSLNVYYPNDIGNIELPEETKFKDNLNRDAEVKEEGFRFVIGNEPKAAEKFTEEIPISQLQSKVNKSRISIFLNGASEKIRPGLTNAMILNGSNGYNINKYYDTIFISLNANKGGIRTSNSYQWIKLNEDLANRTETNIIITLPTAIFGSSGFSDQLESELFHETMVKTKEKGKNIFVVHGGNKNTIDLKDGIRYIGLNTSAISNTEDIYKENLVEFVANGAEISYKIINAFDR